MNGGKARQRSVGNWSSSPIFTGDASAPGLGAYLFLPPLMKGWSLMISSTSSVVQRL